MPWLFSELGVTIGHKLGLAKTQGGPGISQSLRWGGVNYGHSAGQSHCKDSRGDRKSKSAFLHLVGVLFECPHSGSE